MLSTSMASVPKYALDAPCVPFLLLRRQQHVQSQQNTSSIFRKTGFSRPADDSLPLLLQFWTMQGLTIAQDKPSDCLQVTTHTT